MSLIPNHPSIQSSNHPWNGREIFLGKTVELLEAKGIVKIFPGVKALSGVDFSVCSASVHCQRVLLHESVANERSAGYPVEGIVPDMFWENITYAHK
ncbi:MAG TPA: hypothetical protein DET40_16640 [Lentisphaeria bacterium]|nr:hypothetical protein [Lentisphaeria bacterium]